LASTETLTDAATDRILLFDVGRMLYGCEMAAVREIVPARTTTRLPGAPPFVRGLINLRGSIITVIDLAARLDAGHAGLDASVMLVEVGAKLVGLAVDDVRDVQEIPPDRMEPAEGDVARGGVVRGVGHLDDGVVIVLDVEALVRQVIA
jgi:purine-binding chemotaxis protein CheW